MVKFRDIAVLESFFKRNPHIPITEAADPKIHMNVGSTKVNSDNLFTVEIELRCDLAKGDEKIVESQVKVAGIFELVGDNIEGLSVDTFQKVNAPAILYPFVREHLANLSIKAGMNPLIIPTVNFQKMAERKANDKQD